MSPAAHGRGKNSPIAYFGWNFAEGTSQEDLFLANPVNGHIRRLTDDSRAADFISDRDPAWSPDGRTLAIHRSSQASGSLLHLLHGQSGRTLGALVPGGSPEWYDESTLLFLRTGWTADDTGDVLTNWSDIYAVDVDSLAVTKIADFQANSGEVGTMSWHPTAGLALGYTEMVGGVYGLSDVKVVPPAKITAAIAGGPMVTRADLVTAVAEASSPDWSPDGARLAHLYFTEVPYPEDPAATMWVADVAVTDLATGDTVRITDDGPAGRPYGEDHGGQSPAFSPDGTQVAFTRGGEDEWAEIWLSPSTSSSPRRLTDEGRQWFKGGLDW